MVTYNSIKKTGTGDFRSRKRSIFFLKGKIPGQGCEGLSVNYLPFLQQLPDLTGRYRLKADEFVVIRLEL